MRPEKRPNRRCATGPDRAPASRLNSLLKNSGACRNFVICDAETLEKRAKRRISHQPSPDLRLSIEHCLVFQQAVKVCGLDFGGKAGGRLALRNRASAPVQRERP